MYHFRSVQWLGGRLTCIHSFRSARNHESIKRDVAACMQQHANLSTRCSRTSHPHINQTSNSRLSIYPLTSKNHVHSKCESRSSDEQGFFDYNERLFASITQLPASFFDDIDDIRRKSKEERITRVSGERVDEYQAPIQHVSEDQCQIQGPNLKPQQTTFGQDELAVPDSREFTAPGFWPSGEDDIYNFQDIEDLSALTDEAYAEIGNTSQKIPATDQTTSAVDRWKYSTASRRGKSDLSYRDVLRYELSFHTGEETWKMTKTESSSFRANAGLRFLTRNVMNRMWVQGRFGRSPENSQLFGVEYHAVAEIFGPEELTYLQKRDYDIEDVLSWGWILIAPSALSIRRFVAFSQWQDRIGGHAVPLFVPMQILRSENIDAVSLEMFLAETAHLTPSWTWLGSSIPLFIVRLLRHARQVGPSLFPRIVELAQKLFEAHKSDEYSLQTHTRLTHFLNRMLSLLALPSPCNPFRSMGYQQESQLSLIRYMQSSQPQIPINREGYRALAETQLMHEKTASERQWARAKGLSWPPWPPLEQMGTATTPEYTGQKSRVMKVIHRMQESGYSSREADVAAQVLAGWDTDRSPTIQTRQLANSPSVARPWLPGNLVDYSKLPTRVWMARVTSTRSIREAWMCFCAYTDSVASQDRNVTVYHAVFKKLWASTAEDYGHLPGDGREVHPDPKLHRNLVYIPESIPTIKQLYQKMRNDDINPDFRLLSDLLEHTVNLHQGFQYIEDSSLSIDAKTIFQNKAPVAELTLRNTMASIPDYLKASFVHLLSQRQDNEEKMNVTFQKPCFNGSESSPKGYLPHSHELTSIDFALDLLVVSKCHRTLVWNDLLRGIRSHAYPTKTTSIKYGLAQIWRYMCIILQLMETMDISPDLHTFQEVGYVAMQVETWLNEKDRHIEREPLPVVKSLFMSSVSPLSTSKSWIMVSMSDRSGHTPGGDDVELILWCIGATQHANSIDDILRLLRWLSRHRDIVHNADRKLRRQALLAIRVFLEGSWASDTCVNTAPVQRATREQLYAAEKLCEPFGWAGDEEVHDYLKLHSGRFKRVEMKLLSRIAEDRR